MIFTKNFISEALLVILVGICVDWGFSHPVSYRDPSPDQPLPLTSTPKKIKDSFQLNKQVIPIPHNDSKKNLPFKPIAKLRNNDDDPVTYKVKAAKAVGKSLKQGEDDDDDDDDDGGEYGGASDYASCKKNKAPEEPQEKKSMPMMIIRGFDVMAMDVPMPGGKMECKRPTPTTPADLDYDQTTRNGCNKPTTTQNSCNRRYYPRDDLGDQKDPTDKYTGNAWGEWSPCSKSCGEGFQTRSRIKASGSAETQFKTCNLADCSSDPRFHGNSRMAPGSYQRREMMKTRM